MEPHRALAAALVAAFALDAPARATTFSVTGTVTSVSHSAGMEGDGFPFPAMAVGDSFTVVITYSGFDSNPDPDVGTFPDSITSLSITSGNATLTTGVGLSSVAATNDGPGDQAFAGGQFVGLPPLLGDGSFDLVLVGNDAPLGTGVVPDGDLGQLPGWDPAASHFRFSFFSVTHGDGQFEGTVPVPEPGVAGLLAFVLAAARRRSQREELPTFW